MSNSIRQIKALHNTCALALERVESAKNIYDRQEAEKLYVEAMLAINKIHFKRLFDNDAPKEVAYVSLSGRQSIIERVNVN